MIQAGEEKSLTSPAAVVTAGLAQKSFTSISDQTSPDEKKPPESL